MRPNYLIGEKFVGKKWRNFGQVTKLFPDEYGKKWRNFTNEEFSQTNKVIKELLSNTKEIEVVVIDDE